MAVYTKVATFGSVSFELSDVTVTRKPSTLKTNIGKTFIEKSIPLRNATDIVLEVTGIITGLSRTSAQTQSEAIETDRTALIALQDGYKHSYDDGRHSGNFVIVPESLVWDDYADRAEGEPAEFVMTLIQWS